MSDARGAAVKPVVAAIDPSISGAAVWVGRDLVDRRGGVFEAGPPCHEVAERMLRWRDHAERISNAVLGSSHGHPALVVIEGYSYNSRGSVVTLGEFGGILRSQLIERARLVEVSPNTLKKFVTGKGNASKIEVSSTLSQRYGLIFDNSDQYDALALWLIAHAMICGDSFGLVTKRQAAIAREAWPRKGRKNG